MRRARFTLTVWTEGSWDEAGKAQDVLRECLASAERLPADGERVHREYHFRWTVRGHWRHQPVGPGRKEREWIYIFAHVKGPADKPLRQRQRVYRVSGRL